MQPPSATEAFRVAYLDLMDGSPGLAVPSGPLYQRLNEIAKIAGATAALEDYTVEVFGNSGVVAAVGAIGGALAPLGATARADVAAVVADLLLASAVIPVRHGSVGNTAHLGLTSLGTRNAIEIMPADRLVAVLGALGTLLAAGADPLSEPDLAVLGYDRGASLAQRFTSLSLLNLKPTARAALAATPAFQQLLGSPNAVDFLFASDGHDEQQFMTTCTVSALHADVKGRVPALLGLVQVGRGMVEQVRQEIATAPPEVLRSKERSGPLRSRTVEQLATSRVTEAEREFDAIEAAVTALLASTTKSQKDRIAEQERLTARWSRVMQKLSAVTDLTQGVDAIPVLTSKSVSGAWLPSAVVAAPRMADRPVRRVKPGFSDKYDMGVASQVELGPQGTGDDADLSDLLPLGRRATELFWEYVRNRGGLRMGTDGHAMYMRASRQGGQRVIALGDPKVDGLTYFDLDRFEEQVASAGWLVPSSVIFDVTKLYSADLKKQMAAAAPPVVGDADPGTESEAATVEESSGGESSGGESSGGESSSAGSSSETERYSALVREQVGTQNEATLASRSGEWIGYWVVPEEDCSVVGGNLVLGPDLHPDYYPARDPDRREPSGYLLDSGSGLLVTGGAGDAEFVTSVLGRSARPYGSEATGPEPSDTAPRSFSAADARAENRRVLDGRSADPIPFWWRADGVVLFGDGHAPGARPDRAADGEVVVHRQDATVVVLDPSWIEAVAQELRATGVELAAATD